MMRILLTDDHAVVRHGLQHILAKAYPEATFGEACNAEELLHRLQGQEWDVLILDISMPGRSGLEVIEQVRQRKPHLPVLVLSMHPEQQYARRMFRGGASGYLTKDSASTELAQAVAQVLAGQKYVSATLAQEMASSLKGNTSPTPHTALSDREFQVLRRLAAGQRVADIARELSLTVPTVSTYRARVLDKLNLTSTAQLTRYALEYGLIE